MTQARARIRTRHRSSTVMLGLTVVMAATLTACGHDDGPQATHQAVCVDRNSDQRVDDSNCSGLDVNGDDNGTFPFFWYYYLLGSHYPPVGSSINSYPGGMTRAGIGTASFTPAKGGARTGGTLTRGTTVSRGGFGRSGGSGGRGFGG